VARGAALVGGRAVGTALLVHRSQGWSDTTNQPPHYCSSGLDRALRGRNAVLIAGWRGVPCGRRGVSALALPLACVLGVAMHMGSATFPTVTEPRGISCRGPLPTNGHRHGDGDAETACDSAATAQWCPVKHSQYRCRASSTEVSGFTFRLPGTHQSPPPLPTRVMMVGRRVNTPHAAGCGQASAVEDDR